MSVLSFVCIASSNCALAARLNYCMIVSRYDRIWYGYDLWMYIWVLLWVLYLDLDDWCYMILKIMINGFPMALASTEAAFMDSNQPPSPLTNLPEVDVADFHGEKWNADWRMPRCQSFGSTTRWWQLKYFSCSSLFGEDFLFDSYFSNGLKPPARQWFEAMQFVGVLLVGAIHSSNLLAAPG